MRKQTLDYLNFSYTYESFIAHGRSLEVCLQVSEFFQSSDQMIAPR